MKLSLNPYALVIERDNIYHFISADSSDNVQIKPTDAQRACLEKLKKGERMEQTKLANIFTSDIVNALTKQGVLSEVEFDTTSIFSRTDAFFRTFHMPEARIRLQSSHVLILGCGGIGTHMAWHMATAGVGKLTLLDYDTVEESNLNRQILFDRDDFGKCKVDVLKEKLTRINPLVEICTINMCISSEANLERVCTAEKYDLIIKSLDSPNELPLWLDHVCKKHHLTYVAGITMRERVLIGPSFVPQVSEIGWSDLLPAPHDSEKVSGVAPSVGIMLYHISSELAIEAMKILTGYGTLKYLGKIKFHNIFTNQEQIMSTNTKANKQPERKPEIIRVFSKELTLGLMLVACISATGLFSTWMILFAFVVALVLPYYLYNNQQEVMKCTFIASTIFSVISIIDLGMGGLLAGFISEPFQVVSVTVLSFGLLSASILTMCMINFVISKNILSLLKSHNEI